LLDEEKGIWNLSNKGQTTWAELATEVANMAGYKQKSFRAIGMSEMGLVAPRPAYSVLQTEKGFQLPSLENALHRYLKEQEVLII
jgi:dTDP-4-dehydrorhamnose reductase